MGGSGGERGGSLGSAWDRCCGVNRSTPSPDVSARCTRIGRLHMAHPSPCVGVKKYRQEHDPLPPLPAPHGAKGPGTTWSLPLATRPTTLRDMKKRLLASALWFYATWYGLSILANLTGMPGSAGPVIALAVALFVGMDPMHRIWTKRMAPESIALPALEADAA
jgi:hypothetical protein